eukprot:8518780-Alexandrium_andersonii.AAC.1
MKVEAALGPVQFKLRTPHAILHVPGLAREVLFGRFGLHRAQFRRSIRLDRYPVAQHGALGG